jgi:ParB/RepB/Spo0J family partition protein
MSSFENIPIDLLYVSERNVRKNISSSQREESNLETLSNDISKNGLINPISVRKIGDKYEIFAGQRRFRAIQNLGNMKEVPCNVSSHSDNRIEEISLSENIQRTRMTCEDKCNAFYKFYKNHNDNINTVANVTSLHPRTVTNYVTLKEKLNPHLVPHLDKWGDDRLTIETGVNMCEFVKDPIEHPKVFNDLKKFRNDKEKKEFLQKYKDKKDGKEESKESKEKSDAKESKEKSKKELEKKKNEPWVPNMVNKKEKLYIPEKYFQRINDMILNKE